MWKNASLTGSSKESKRNTFWNLGKKPESVCRYTGLLEKVHSFFSFCFDVYKNQEKQSEKVFLTCRLPFPAEEPLSQTRLNIRP